MKTVLCFGDSNTWGFDPASFTMPAPRRLPHDVRWTGVLARELGSGWRVIEEGQNGRMTVHDDPFNACRNGRDYLPACLESHKPLDVVVMMLGTNDLKAVVHAPPGEIATGAGVLARMILQSDAGIRNAAPRLLLVCPPQVGDVTHLPGIREKIPDATERSADLPRWYEALAGQLGCAYLNSQELIAPSPLDGIHLDAAAHERLGVSIARSVAAMA